MSPPHPAEVSLPSAVNYRGGGAGAGGTVAGSAVWDYVTAIVTQHHNWQLALGGDH